MDKVQSKVAKERTWRAHLTRHAASGKSIAAFCRAEQISQANFYAWRTKLRSDAVGLTVPSADPAFIDLGAMSRPTADRSTTHLPTAAAAAPKATLQATVNSSIELRLNLGGGLVLTIMRR